MSRRVVTEFELSSDQADLVEQTLEQLDATYEETDSGFRVTKVDGAYLGREVEIDLEEGEISHTVEDAPTEFVDEFRQTFSENKFYREARIQGHRVDSQWVSDGEEEHHLLEEAEEGDVVIEASVAL